jgi:nucleoid DNA-binding protein
MNKSDIANELAKTFVSQKDAEKAVNKAFDMIASALSNGEKVVISGFGTFKVHTRPARTGRNPKTGEQVAVGPKKIVRFKSSKHLFS